MGSTEGTSECSSKQFLLYIPVPPKWSTSLEKYNMQAGTDRCLVKNGSVVQMLYFNPCTAQHAAA